MGPTPVSTCNGEYTYKYQAAESVAGSNYCSSCYAESGIFYKVCAGVNKRKKQQFLLRWK